MTINAIVGIDFISKFIGYKKLYIYLLNALITPNIRLIKMAINTLIKPLNNELVIEYNTSLVNKIL